MAAHSSVVGGSTAGIMLACPGHRRLLPNAPPEKPSEFAAIGTALHNAIETLCRSQMDGENVMWPMDFVGWKCPETGQIITKDQCYNKLGPAWDAFSMNILNAGPSEVLFEVQGAFTPIEDSFGTIDVFAVFDDRVVIWDWKFGDGVMVSPRENKQLLYYASTALFTPALHNAVQAGKPVELWICQPSERSDIVADVWQTDVATLAAFSSELIKAVNLSEQDDAPLSTGSHCRWCKARVNCPELKVRAETAVHLDPHDMDADELNQLLRLAEEVEPWAKAVKAYAHARLEEGKAVTDWKLVQKRATRKWSDEAEAAKVLGKLQCEASDAYLPLTLRSPPQIEKLLGKAKFKKECAGLVRSVSSGTTLAPASDKREGVVPANTFKQLGDQLQAQNHRK